LEGTIWTYKKKKNKQAKNKEVNESIVRGRKIQIEGLIREGDMFNLNSQRE
jgi:hypothetical protein